MDTYKYKTLTLTYSSVMRDEPLPTLAVVSCEKDVTEVVIPNRVEGMPVVEIADHAFDGCSQLACVTFEEADEQQWMDWATFERVGERAFQDCVSLREIVLPESLSCEIGWSAFYNCTSLKYAVYPKRTTVEGYAFSRCDSLEKASPARSIGEAAFSFCKKLKQLPLGEGITSIEEDTFEHCYDLTEVTIPKSVRYIGALAFRNCHGLRRVTFESPENWYFDSRYFSANDTELNLSDPERNARSLAGMDFDDGVISWYKSEEKPKPKANDFEEWLKKLMEE